MTSPRLHQTPMPRAEMAKLRIGRLMTRIAKNLLMLQICPTLAAKRQLASDRVALKRWEKILEESPRWEAQGPEKMT